MAFKIYYEKDCELALIRSKKVAIIGYGSQAHAHAQNLKDSGVRVSIGLRKGSLNEKIAKEAGFFVASIKEVSKDADLIMLLTPDEYQKEIYEEHIKDILGDKILGFAHGFNIHYGYIKTKNAIMIAPKGPGPALRAKYLEGSGLPALIACENKEHLPLCLSYACAIGAGKVGIMQTTFKDECQSDLFGEQAVLCGGLSALVEAGFNTLVEAGYPPEIAYFECFYEVQLVVNLMEKGGLAFMRERISNTAEYGSLIAGEKIINKKSKEAMKELLENIQNASFAKAFMAEKEAGFKNMKAKREATKNSELEKIGEKLRKSLKL